VKTERSVVVGLSDDEARLLWQYHAFLRAVGLALCSPASAAQLWVEPGEDVRPGAYVALRDGLSVMQSFAAWRERQAE
jgi:hypothetical protein